MKKCLLLGNGGREAVLAEAISQGYELYSIMPYENPSISNYVKSSNGKFLIGDPFNKNFVEGFIKKEQIDTCLISSDNLLQDGLIDLAKSLGLKTFGPTSKGAKIEWSKTYALDIVNEIAPEMVIKNYQIKDEERLKQVIDTYEDDSFVVKPEGLTGGKGVKVGGIHFKGKDEGFNYAKGLLQESGKVIIQDKVDGREFTVMALTDGENIVTTPITFDYPYRYDEDKGPGTGGMGCLSFENGLLPFLEQEDVDKCSKLIKDVINYLNKDSFEFNGVIYGGFFKTSKGIKFIEFNARFGDPEAMNVLNMLDTPFAEVMENIFNKNLNTENCKFKKKASCLVYMVSPNYALSGPKTNLEYMLNKEEIENKGAKVYFASSKQIDNNKYTSVGTSRLVAVIAIDNTLEDAKKKVYNAIKGNISENLDYRKDIGTIYVH